MATSPAYVLKSAVFTPAGGSPSAVTITGLQTISYGTQGSVVAHSHDAAQAVTEHFIDDISGDCSITTTDLSDAQNAALKVSEVGSLVLTYQKRAAGSGAAAGSDLTVTAAEATVTANTGQAGSTGLGEATISFACADSDGAEPWAFS